MAHVPQHSIDPSRYAMDDKLDAQRDKAVDKPIGLVCAVDGIVQMQAKADADYFAQVLQAGADRRRSSLKRASDQRRVS